MSELLQMPDRTSTRGRVAAGVRAQLAIAGLSASRAAKMLGISQSAMSRRVTGEHPFDVDELGGLADLLGLDIADFMSYGAPKPSGPNSGTSDYKGEVPLGELIPFESKGRPSTRKDRTRPSTRTA